MRSRPEQAGRWLFGEDSGEEGGGLPLGPSPASPPPQTSIRDGVTLSMWIFIFCPPPWPEAKEKSFAEQMNFFRGWA